jgi:hypothetical protein
VKCHFASIMLNVKLMNAILLNVMVSFGTADNFDFFAKNVDLKNRMLMFLSRAKS